MSNDGEDFRVRGARLSNWGRWGEHDIIGTANLITPERRAAAAELIGSGRTFDLSMALGRSGPQTTHPRRFNPIHTMLTTPGDGPHEGGMLTSDDMLTLALQGATQWDGLSHVGYDGMFYNGVPASDVTAADGARSMAIDALTTRLVGRGVLLDIARLTGVERMGAGEEITADDLSAAEERQGVRVQSGDILLIRTGWFQHYLAGDMSIYTGAEPGPGTSCCQWLYDREVAAVAADNWAFEVMPAVEKGVLLPVHVVLIRDMGMTIGEMFALEELAADCESDGTWDFFLSAAPLRVSNAVGSPVTPLAIK